MLKQNGGCKESERERVSQQPEVTSLVIDLLLVSLNSSNTLHLERRL